MLMVLCRCNLEIYYFILLLESKRGKWIPWSSSEIVCPTEGFGLAYVWDMFLGLSETKEKNGFCFFIISV